MHIQEQGIGVPVLFLHGGGVAGWMWRPTLTHLQNRVRAIVPDLPGHGDSADQDYRSHVETIAELVAVLEQRAPSGALVVGFSLGAQLAILLAAHRPDLVRGVVVVSAQTVPLTLPGPTLAILKASAPLARQEWFARLQARELFIPPELMADYVRGSARMSRNTLVTSVGENIRFQLPEAWASFPGPALIMVGAKERRLMRDSARATHDALAGSELRTVADCGHGIPLQRPELLAEAIAELAGPETG